MNRFPYLSKSDCFEVEGVNDQKEFEDVLNAMRIINISETDKFNILKIIAGVLHLGSIAFKSEGNYAQPENLNGLLTTGFFSLLSH